MRGVIEILCFGDSNTYGFTPDWKHRYGRDIRYPGVLQTLLGDGYYVAEDGLVGRTGTVTAVLRPSGKIVLDGIYYDAVAENGLFIGRGEKVRVVRVGNGQLYCKQDFSDPSES